MKNVGLREKEDTAIGCSFVAIVLLGIALIALFHMFSFTELFSNISSIYALLFIKCNVNQGNKIYHLPFDQQYDRTQICKPGEFYAYTVKEAVTAGFRRAYRHRF